MADHFAEIVFLKANLPNLTPKHSSKTQLGTRSLNTFCHKSFQTIPEFLNISMPTTTGSSIEKNGSLASAFFLKVTDIGQNNFTFN